MNIPKCGIVECKAERDRKMIAKSLPSFCKMHGYLLFAYSYITILQESVESNACTLIVNEIYLFAFHSESARWIVPRAENTRAFRRKTKVERCFRFFPVFCVFDNKMLYPFVSRLHFAKCSRKEQKFAYFYLYQSNGLLVKTL